MLGVAVAELAGCNGVDGRPLLVGINGYVLDMSSHPTGPSFYGPGNTYNVFTGRDATVGSQPVSCMQCLAVQCRAVQCPAVRCAFCSTLLFCTVPCRAVLCIAVRCCAVPGCAVPCCAVRRCAVRRCAVVVCATTPSPDVGWP